MEFVTVQVLDQEQKELRKVFWKTSRSVKAAKDKLKADYGFEGALKQDLVDLDDDDTLQVGASYKLERKGPGLVRVDVIVEGETQPQDSDHAHLECWTDDGTMGTYKPVKTRSNDSLQLHVGKLWSPVKKGKDKCKFDLILGKPGMKKLGLGIDPAGFVYKKKRLFRK